MHYSLSKISSKAHPNGLSEKYHNKINSVEHCFHNSFEKFLEANRFMLLTEPVWHANSPRILNQMEILLVCLTHLSSSTEVNRIIVTVG